MRTKEDIRSALSVILSDFRTKHGLSKTKIAETLGIDKHTWIRWERGENTPALEDLIIIFDKLGEDLMPHIMNILYPNDPRDPVSSYRKDAAIYYLDQATAHQARVWKFMTTCLSQQEQEAQTEEFCAINHLPLEYRWFLAEQVYLYYTKAIKSNEIQHTTEAMPDMDIFIQGLKRTQKAAFDKLK